MRAHNPHGCIKRLIAWIHRNVRADGFTADAGDTDQLCRIAADIQAVCAEETLAVRQVQASGGVGSCKCSKCGWRVDPFDIYCRRCGARFTETEYGSDDKSFLNNTFF